MGVDSSHNKEKMVVDATLNLLNLGGNYYAQTYIIHDPLPMLVQLYNICCCMPTISAMMLLLVKQI